MQQLNKRWLVSQPIPDIVYHNLNDFHPIMRQILYNRGYETRESAEQYFRAISPPDSIPSNLLGIDEAVTRIRWAIHKKEPIAIYGDYDVDGVTATALLTEILQALGAEVEGYIPNRFDEGYGLNNVALDDLHNQGKRLIITVDCGIRSPAEVEHAKNLGMDIIITDHHHPGDELPIASSIINPKQMEDTYPYKELAGVGLAYKLASAVVGQEVSLIENSLDLVALGTVADLAPLIGENRALVRSGLKHLREPHRQGLRSLIGVTRLTASRITARDIGYVLGPRLNAAGRLDTAYTALELLLARNVQLAAKLAQMLEIQNRERQMITRQVQEHAEEQVLASDPDAFLLFAVDPSYNVGVVGLAASRLTERYYRPSIVSHQGDEFTRGSCRSIPEFHITEALDKCADLLEHHGGHAAAAGFTISNQRLPEFIERLKLIAADQLSDQDLRPMVRADVELPLSDLKPEILDYLAWLEPTGKGNPQAKFVSRDIFVTKHRKVGKDGSHLKLTVSDRQITYDAIAFRQGHWADKLPPRVDLLYTFEKNVYQNRENLQLNVVDLKPAGDVD
jgi:single-stranded-DNA-specific exonuclease